MRKLSVREYGIGSRAPAGPSQAPVPVTPASIELDAMASVATALHGLDGETRARVLRWVVRTFEDETVTQHSPQAGIADVRVFESEPSR